ncbi:MAG: hypothetical protein KF779_15585 [Hyphomonadaceae bacterium]|nr:hypothetical protein [Hyphomonadaceae bacterium]
MILRRIIEQVKAQNWTAVAIDFFIVVFGVFIGMQVTNWNAANADRRALGRYLDAVASDIRSDVNELTRVEEDARDRVTASTYVLRAAGAPDLNNAISFGASDTAANDVFTRTEAFQIADGEPLSEDELGRLWGLIVGGYMYDTNRTAFDALINSGNIDLINDPELMQLLREYYYLVNGLEQTQSRTLAPIRLRAIETGIRDGLSPQGLIDEDAFVRLVRNDRALRATIAAAREDAAFHLLLAGATKDKAEAVIRALEERRAP